MTLAWVLVRAAQEIPLEIAQEIDHQRHRRIQEKSSTMTKGTTQCAMLQHE